MGFLCTIGSLDQDPQSGCDVGAGLARSLLSQEGKSAGTNPLAQRRGALQLYIEHFLQHLKYICCIEREKTN